MRDDGVVEHGKGNRSAQYEFLLVPSVSNNPVPESRTRQMIHLLALLMLPVDSFFVRTYYTVDLDIPNVCTISLLGCFLA